jgi:hypothetical protein
MISPNRKESNGVLLYSANVTYSAGTDTMTMMSINNVHQTIKNPVCLEIVVSSTNMISVYYCTPVTRVTCILVHGSVIGALDVPSSKKESVSTSTLMTRRTRTSKLRASPTSEVPPGVRLFHPVISYCNTNTPKYEYIIKYLVLN